MFSLYKEIPKKKKKGKPYDFFYTDHNIMGLFINDSAWDRDVTYKLQRQCFIYKPLIHTNGRHTYVIDRVSFDVNGKDHSLFALDKAKVRIHVLVYVDDLIITSNISSEINKFKDYLSTCFKMKDLGIFWYFVGLEVAYSPT